MHGVHSQVAGAALPAAASCLGLPERTAQSFTPHVVYPHLGAGVSYRAGDVVREQAGGNYIYFGRRDNQIKSRGYGMELGEIETVLYSHPDIE